MPKNSQKAIFKYTNFPTNLIDQLKKECNMDISFLSTYFGEEEEVAEKKSLRMNKLESFLLKLAIPFIRIAHCPRGPYFKVKGDLILISADISHSLSKILPLEQNLIPVAFKRKLAYKGSYIEEFIEKKKVIIYFSWLKKFNHLYKDYELENGVIEKFIKDTIQSSENFESNTKTNACHQTYSEDVSITSNVSDHEEDILEFNKEDVYEPPEIF